MKDTDIIIIKSTQNQYFIGSHIFEYPELKMPIDAVLDLDKIDGKSIFYVASVGNLDVVGIDRGENSI